MLTEPHASHASPSPHVAAAALGAPTPLFLLPSVAPSAAADPVDSAVVHETSAVFAQLRAERDAFFASHGAGPEWEVRLMFEASALLAARDGIDEHEAFADVAAEVTRHDDPAALLEWLVTTTRAIARAELTAAA